MFDFFWFLRYLFIDYFLIISLGVFNFFFFVLIIVVRNLHQVFLVIIYIKFFSELLWTTFSPVKDYNCVSLRRACSFG